MQSELVGFRNAKSPRDIGSSNAPCGRQLTSHGQSRSYLRTEGSIHRPRGLSVLYCPFSDGPPLGKGWRQHGSCQCLRYSSECQVSYAVDIATESH